MSAVVVVILNLPIVVIVEAAIGLLCVSMSWHLELPVYKGGFNYLESCILPLFFGYLSEERSTPTREIHKEDLHRSDASEGLIRETHEEDNPVRFRFVLAIKEDSTKNWEIEDVTQLRKICQCRKRDDDRACNFFKWLDTSICCTRGVATTPIDIAKFKRLEHVVKVANEELKQAHSIGNGASCKTKG
ncbi:hypothetical protein CFP56_036216 [Quercus suber]|uniref:Uncharacterized protein n=1 Tax=Quercus suber TaxID=58331 RepID=A0AAW0J813_QUESU